MAALAIHKAHGPQLDTLIPTMMTRAQIGSPAVSASAGQLSRPSQKKTNDLTTRFLRQGAFSGAVGSTHEVWNDHRETEPSVTES
jgi:hypothetical protein